MRRSVRAEPRSDRRPGYEGSAGGASTGKRFRCNHICSAGVSAAEVFNSLKSAENDYVLSDWRFGPLLNVMYDT